MGGCGESNALDIAASLGFDLKVLTRARELVTKLVPATLGERTSDLMVPLVKQRDEQRERAQAAGVALAGITKLHDEVSSSKVYRGIVALLFCLGKTGCRTYNRC